MWTDTMTVAARKNRVSRSSLETEFSRLNHERESEMKMLNNEKQMFKVKYSKLELMLDGIRSNNASDVRMYETHNPMFCYKRNGEARLQQAPSQSPTVEFEEVHGLLFTNGELDIEKILCLHLLAAHRTETLTAAPRAVAYTGTSKELSPVERLIERSKKKHEDTLTKLLPTYVLDIEDDQQAANSASKMFIRDGRLAQRLLINDRILQLIETVLSALQKSNPEKLDELVKLAENPDSLKKIVNKPHIQNFIHSLKNLTLLSSCESFFLTQPFKAKSIPLDAKSATGGLESLVKQIRANVLQMPQSTWKPRYQRRSSMEDDKREENVKFSRRRTKENTSTEEYENVKSPEAKFLKKDFISKNKEALATIPKRNYEEDEVSVEKGSKGNRRRSSDSNRNDSISGSRQKSRPVVKNSTETNQDISIKLSGDMTIPSGTKTNLDAGEVANLLKTKVETANRKDLRGLGYPIKIEENPRLASISSRQSDMSDSHHAEHRKYSLKQITCNACLEKWKAPLPPPKTPRIKKNCVPVLDKDTYKEVKTESTHRLSQMINRELAKTKENKSRNISVDSGRSRRDSDRESFLKKYSLDIVDLNELDLAKIRQEIKEKETKKKLEKFLSEKV